MPSPLLLDQPSRPSRATVVGFVVLGSAYLGGCLAVASRSEAPMRALPWMAVTYAMVMSVVTGVTAFLLYSSAERKGGLGYVALGATFTTVCIVQLAMPLCFPGVVRDDPLVGGPQSSVALFYLWHLVFLVGLPVSALLLRHDAESARPAPPPRGRLRVQLAFLLPGALVVTWALLLPDRLPVLLVSGGITGVASELDWLLLVAALVGVGVILWSTRAATPIGRWLLAVSVIGVGESLVNIGAQRYSLGWYFNRSVGLLMLSLLMFALLGEIAKVDRSTYAVASRDVLTGVMSRAMFDHQLRHEVSMSVLRRSPLALLEVDLDRFKGVNDEYGHAAGDELLVHVVQRMVREVRSTDVVARLGGDEFAVLITDDDAHDVAEHVAARLVGALALPFHVADDLVHCPCSVGVALFPDDAGTVEDLLRHADQAMYDAKQAGGGRYCRYRGHHQTEDHGAA